MYDEIVNHMFVRYLRLEHPQPNMPTGNMKSPWKDRLLYKFRNNRKRADHMVPEVEAKSKNTGSKGQSSAVPQTDVVRQWGMACHLPTRSPSEDVRTLKAHEEFLQKEKRKRQPDFERVKLAMDKTLSERREWLIISHPRPLINAVKERFPWLFDEDQITEEMMRLQDTSTPLVKTFKAGMRDYAVVVLVKRQGVKKLPKCFIESRAPISAQRMEEDRQDATCKTAFLILPKLLRDNIHQICVAPDAEALNPVHLRMNAASIGESTAFTLIADEEEIATSNSFFDA